MSSVAGPRRTGSDLHLPKAGGGAIAPPPMRRLLRDPLLFRCVLVRSAEVPWAPPARVVERTDGKTDSRRALRACARSRRRRRGRPLLQEPVLGAADGERRNRAGVRGVLSEVPETSMSAAAAMRLT